MDLVLLLHGLIRGMLEGRKGDVHVGQLRTLLFSLLVRSPFDSLLTFFPVAVVTFLIDAVLNASRTWPLLVALLARLLAVGARVFDLATLGLELRDSNYTSTRTRKVCNRNRSWWREGYWHRGAT